MLPFRTKLLEKIVYTGASLSLSLLNPLYSVFHSHHFTKTALSRFPRTFVCKTMWSSLSFHLNWAISSIAYSWSLCSPCHPFFTCHWNTTLSCFSSCLIGCCFSLLCQFYLISRALSRWNPLGLNYWIFFSIYTHSLDRWMDG